MPQLDPYVFWGHDHIHFIKACVFWVVFCLIKLHADLSSSELNKKIDDDDVEDHDYYYYYF